MTLRFLFDTDHLTLYERGHPLLMQRFNSQQMDEVGISPMTVEESLRGRLSSLARRHSGQASVMGYATLVTTVRLLNRFTIVDFDQRCEALFQHLAASVRPRVGSQDLRIAATALVHNLTVLTRNRRDFGRVPGIALDDWSI